MTGVVTRAEIEASARRIAPHVRSTPVLDVGTALSPDYSLSLKLEHLQVTGSFKARGAFSVLTSVEVPSTGVVAASGGNFGIAVAHAASRLGHTATIFVPETSPSEKIDRIAKHGAEVRVIPGYYDQARETAEAFAMESGAFQAHPFDQAEVVAGQGTLAFELDHQTIADVVMAAVGGGGLIAGIASWFRDQKSVVAAEPVNCRSFNAALEAERPVEVNVSGVAVSSLGARSVGTYAWETRHWIDESVVVSDDAIVEAQNWLWSVARLAVEPAAATGVAALQTGAFIPERGSRVVVVLSGGNVDPGTVV